MNLKQNNNRAIPDNSDLFDDGIENDKKDIIDDNPIDDDYNDDFYPDMSQPTSIQKYNDLLKELTNFNPIIADVVNGWLGLTWNERNEKYETNPNIIPIMNMKGAMWCISYLKTYAKKTNLITHIDADEYKWLYWDINRVVWIDFATRDDFGVKNNQDYHRIGMEIVHTALLVITGAGGGKYNQFFGSTTMRTEHVNVGNNQQGQMQMPMQKKKVGLLGHVKNMLVGGK
jgi:hypothetical protein